MSLGPSPVEDPTTALHQKYHDGTLQCHGLHGTWRATFWNFVPRIHVGRSCIDMYSSIDHVAGWKMLEGILIHFSIFAHCAPGDFRSFSPGSLRYTMENMEWVEKRGWKNLLKSAWSGSSLTPNHSIQIIQLQTRIIYVGSFHFHIFPSSIVHDFLFKSHYITMCDIFGHEYFISTSPHQKNR